MPGFGQAFNDLFLALPMHTKVLELLLDGQGMAGVVGIIEKVPHSLGLLLGQRLAHIEPVSLDDAFQRTELVREFLRSTWTHRRHVQLVEQTAQGGAGGEFRAEFALLLQLQTAFVR